MSETNSKLKIVRIVTNLQNSDREIEKWFLSLKACTRKVVYPVIAACRPGLAAEIIDRIAKADHKSTERPTATHDYINHKGLAQVLIGKTDASRSNEFRANLATAAGVVAAVEAIEKQTEVMAKVIDRQTRMMVALIKEMREDREFMKTLLCEGGEQ